MKPLVYMVCTVALVAMVTSCAVSQEARQRKADREAFLMRAITDSLADRHFQVDVDKAYPQYGKAMIHLSDSYCVKVYGDTIDSYLPFFGRAYSVPYGGGKGLIFKGLIKNYNDEVDGKGAHTVSMEVRGEEDIYLYVVFIDKYGGARVSVQPRERSHISFSGDFHIEE